MNRAVPDPGTGVLPSVVYQIPVFDPVSVSVTFCVPLEVPLEAEIAGAVLVTAEQVDPVVFPLIVGGALVGGVVSWFMSVFDAAI
jgi:hypothetical protein